MTDTTQAAVQMDPLTQLVAILGSMPAAEQRAMIQKFTDEANGALRVLNARNQPG